MFQACKRWRAATVRAVVIGEGKVRPSDGVWCLFHRSGVVMVSSSWYHHHCIIFIVSQLSFHQYCISCFAVMFIFDRPKRVMCMACGLLLKRRSRVVGPAGLVGLRRFSCQWCQAVMSLGFCRLEVGLFGSRGKSGSMALVITLFDWSNHNVSGL